MNLTRSQENHLARNSSRELFHRHDGDFLPHEEALLSSDDGDGSIYLERWYESFTCCTTIRFALGTTGPALIFYGIWAWLWGCYMRGENWEFLEQLEASFVLRVFTFLVGVLISLTLKEGIDRYRKCLAALLDLRDELQSFWYFCQLPLMEVPAAQVLVDIHVSYYTLALVRYLANKADMRQHRSVASMVQPEFQSCVLFENDKLHDGLSANPAYAEILLISWLRSMGIVNTELRIRFKWVRSKLLGLLTARSVKSPRTSMYLLRTVVHLYLLVLPICSGSLPTKLSPPFIALVLFPLITLAEEMEDPFGVDRHDLPWASVLGSVMRCHLSKQSEEVIHEAVSFFNNGCKTGQWDEGIAKRLFGKKTMTKPGKTKSFKHDSGQPDLSKYPIISALEQFDIVGDIKLGSPDALYSNSSTTWNGEDDWSSDGELSA